jgi:hypothetical protein
VPGNPSILRDEIVANISALATVDKLDTVKVWLAIASAIVTHVDNSYAMGTMSSFAFETNPAVLKASNVVASVGTSINAIRADHAHPQVTFASYRLLWANSGGHVAEITLGTVGEALLSNGLSAAPSFGPIVAGITYHDLLANLSYASSGHTGFSPTAHTHTLASISDVSIVTAVDGQFLRKSGSNWVNETVDILPQVGGDNYFLDNTDAAEGGYKSLSKWVTATAEVIKSGVVKDTDGDVLVEGYLIPPTYYGFIRLLPTTAIVFGEWNFSTWCNVDIPDGSTTIKYKVYKRDSEGTETELFTAETDEINNTSLALNVLKNVQVAPFYITATDSLVCKIYIATTHTSDVTVSYAINGTEHHSSFAIPTLFADLLHTHDYSGTTLDVGALLVGGEIYPKEDGYDLGNLNDNAPEETARWDAFLVNANIGGIETIRGDGSFDAYNRPHAHNKKYVLYGVTSDTTPVTLDGPGGQYIEGIYSFYKFSVDVVGFNPDYPNLYCAYSFKGALRGDGDSTPHATIVGNVIREVLVNTITGSTDVNVQANSLGKLDVVVQGVSTVWAATVEMTGVYRAY